MRLLATAAPSEPEDTSDATPEVAAVNIIYNPYSSCSTVSEGSTVITLNRTSCPPPTVGTVGALQVTDIISVLVAGLRSDRSDSLFSTVGERYLGR